jgi:hypothetical protein
LPTGSVAAKRKESTPCPTTRIGSEANPRFLILDVNETLIDFESMNALFERVFCDKRVLREWLGHLIMYSMTITLSGLYKDYWALGGGVFERWSGSSTRSTSSRVTLKRSRTG